VIYCSDYVSEKDMNDVDLARGEVEFIHSDKAGIASDFFCMSDKISVIGMAGEDIDPYIIANDKREIKDRFPEYCPKNIIRKPRFGRDSLGVEVTGGDDREILEEMVEGREVSVLVFNVDGKLTSLSMEVLFDGGICTAEIKDNDMERFKDVRANDEESIAKFLYQKMGWKGRGVRFDFRGRKLLDVNAFGSLGLRGWNYNCCAVNGISYAEYLSMTFGGR